MSAIETLHERLDREHTEALLTNYSADYEAWLEDRIVQLEAENDEESKLRKRLGDLLEQTANALKGEPELLHLHDWSDLPEVAKQLEAENERYRRIINKHRFGILQVDDDHEIDLEALGGKS